MKRFFRLYLALIVMSLFSVSYLVTSASADPGNHPPMGAPGYAPGTAPMGAPGMAPGYAPGTAPMGAPGMAPGYAPPMGAPGMAPGTAGEASGSSYSVLSQPGTGPHDGPGEVDISHCASLPPTTRPACEAAAHGGPGNHAPPE